MPSLPTAPVPAPGPGAAAATGGPALAPDTTSWQIWWEFHKEPFLVRRRGAGDVAQSGSDDFYLGQRRPEARIDLLAPTVADLHDRIVPALGRLLAAERNRDIQGACLLALAKIGRDGADVDLERALAGCIARDDQEVRESAVLALGIGGRPSALPPLAALVRDDAEGRRLVDRARVGDRTRAFAAYGLGLLAHRSDDRALKQAVHDLLWPLLGDPAVQDRDLRAAAVTGLGLLAGPGDGGGQRRLAWQTAEELLAWYERDLGRGAELVQAHAPVAVGRLLGRGTTALHQRCKEHFAAVLAGSARRSNPVLQSAALALGMLALPAEHEPRDAAAARALQGHYERGHDRQARGFCVIALGRIGGAANRSWLLSTYARDRKATERPWLALALGLLAHSARAEGRVDDTIAALLLDDLQSTGSDDVRAALGLATGLCGDSRAAPILLRLLQVHEGNERQAGYLCVALALLEDPAAEPVLLAILQRSQRRPFLLQQAAVALGRLGDRKAAPILVDMVQRSDSTAVLSALATAIGRIGDRRSFDPLLAALADRELTKLSRAFVAAALGGVGDKDPMPWYVPISVDGNYAAAVETLWNGSTGVLDIL
ncbi:MAG: HEAT repeat domain-containing protein [Planctomycetes bacterium]|nr:HEAT repeat domain-containing protein [Planctomycetota bacterium]